MYFERDKIKEVVSHVLGHADEIHAVMMENDIVSYLAALDSIAVQKKYNEGETISEEHRNAIKFWVKEAIENSARYVIEAANDPEKQQGHIENPVDNLLTISDYFYVLAMERLGCPDIRLLTFDEDVKNKIRENALAINRSVNKYNFSKEDEFTRQRGKNAKELQKSFNNHRNAIVNPNDKPRHMGELIAEYQALKERQSRHGDIWRFFHSKENKARNELLKSMARVITVALKSTQFAKNAKNLDALDPSDVARKLADEHIRENVKTAASDRVYGKTEEIFGRLSADTEKLSQEKKEKETEQKVPMSNDKEFMADISDKKNELSAPVNNEKSIEKDNVVAKDSGNVSVLD